MFANVLISNISFLMAKKVENYPSLLTEFRYSAGIEEMAKQGDSNALWMYGLHNMTPQAKDFLSSVVKLNDNEFEQQINSNEAIKYVEKSAKKGNPIAMILLGRLEYLRHNKESNLYKSNEKKGETALKWYEKAMNQGYGDACALIYAEKMDHPNFKNILYNESLNALEYLNTGVSMKSPLSAKYLGLHYLKDPVDYHKAFEMFFLVEELGFYSPELTDCYFDGLGCNKNYYIAIKRLRDHLNTPHSIDTWEKFHKLSNPSSIQATYNISNINAQQLLFNPDDFNFSIINDFKEDSSTCFSDSLFLLKQGGLYYITNLNGEHLSHSFDNAKIEGDSIYVYFDKYSTIIGKDGFMKNPIPNQMLQDWLKDGITNDRKKLLEKWICSWDATGEYGVASILMNNKGVAMEQSFKPSNSSYKNGKGINKKIGKAINEAKDKGNLNVIYSKALPYYERAIELNPYFELAQMNAQRLHEALKNLTDCDSSPFIMGLSSCLELSNSIFQIQNHKQSNLLEDTKRTTKNIRKKTKHRSQAAVVSEVQNKRFAQHAYDDYITQLSAMNTWRDRYDDNQRKSIQKSMKQIREKHGFPKSEWEDWNGKPL